MLMVTGLIAALSLLAQTPVSAASRGLAAADSTALTARMMPFLSLKPDLRAARTKHSLHRAGSTEVTLRGRSGASAVDVSGALRIVGQALRPREPLGR